MELCDVLFSRSRGKNLDFLNIGMHTCNFKSQDRLSVNCVFHLSQSPHFTIDNICDVI